MRTLLYIVAFVNLLMALIVIKSNHRKTENRFFAIFLFAAIFWAVGDALMLYSDSYSLAHTGVVLFYVAPLITTLFVVFFSFVFPDNRPISNRTIVILSIPAAIFFVAMSLWPDMFLQSITIVSGGQNIIVHHPTPYKIYALYFNIYFLITYIKLIASYRRNAGQDKKRVGYAFVSIFVASFAALFTNLTLPILGKNQYVFAGPMFLLFFAVVVAWGIIKHKFFDIRLVVARSLAYILSVVLLASVYGFIAFNIINEYLFSNGQVDFWQRTTYTLLAVIIAFTFQPIKHFFDKWTNKIFYQDAYDSQALLNDLNSTLVTTLDLDVILESTSLLIEHYIKPSIVTFAIYKDGAVPEKNFSTASDRETDVHQVINLARKFSKKVTTFDDPENTDQSFTDEASKLNISMAVQLNAPSQQKIVGAIILGPKKSGNPYAGQDQRIMEIIADELVIAIQNALRFEEIQQFNITLQEKVDKATAELRKANAKLVAMDQTKDDFISMASHQLRTPLTSVKGYVSMVLEGDVGKITKEQRKLLDQSFLSAQRMVYLIADLLNVSRLKTGKFVIEPKPSNLADVIEGELEQLKETAAARKLEMKFDKPKDFPVLNLDETKIRQVIMNFADNAIYYTPAGGHIEVKLVDKGDSVEFTVTDDGIGVPKSEQHNLFTKFYRAGNAKKARPDGTGLGLFMAKKVVIAQGGSIIFKTQEGKGSTFGFSFEKKRLTPETHSVEFEPDTEETAPAKAETSQADGEREPAKEDKSAKK